MKQLFESRDDEEDFARKASKNLLDVFVTPEVTRRQERGELPRPLDLRAAQIIFYADGRKPLIRINEEVKAIAKVKLEQIANQLMA